MPELELVGVRARPQLVGWLKGLGVLRVVAEQADPAARLAWRRGTATLQTELGLDELERFFIERYRPAPVASPWNGASGFFPDHYRAAADALAQVEALDDPRLAPLRDVVRTGRQVLARLELKAKPEALRVPVLREMRARASDNALRWIDAAVVLQEDRARFPPLLGTGGNDGNWDIAANYAQAVLLALGLGTQKKGAPTPADLLRGSLLGLPTPLPGASLGHFHRDTSPTSAPQGEGPGYGNPWDLVLAVEGSLMMAAGASRRYGAADAGASAPFTMRPVAAGYGSAVTGEKGREELWLPVWSAPASIEEVEAVLREGRAQIGRSTARDALDALRAAGELGVARGIDAFERYTIVERAGQSSLAVAVGSVDVRHRPGADVLAALDPWWRRLRRKGVDDHAPGSLRHATGELQQALFGFADRPEPAGAQRLLVALGRAERTLATSGIDDVSPLHSLPADTWLNAADDGSEAFVLAAALGSLHDAAVSVALPALRDYLHGTAMSGDPARRTYAPSRKVDLQRSAPALRLLVELHRRRHLDAGRAEVPLPFSGGIPVDAASLALLLRTPEPVLARALPLAAGIALLEHRGSRWKPRRVERLDVLPPVLGLLLLAWHDQWRSAGSAEGDKDIALRPRPGWAAALAGGTDEALHRVVDQAILRLRRAERPALVRADDLLRTVSEPRALSVALLLRPSDDLLHAQADQLTRTPEGART